MNDAFAGWWLARGVVVRRLVKFVLGLLAIIGMLLFVSFNMTGKGSAASGTKMILTIGQPEPWLVWERITANGLAVSTNGASTTMSMTANSGVHIFSSSFVAGVIALYSIGVLRRASRVEKQNRNS